jgi:diguanylate cyclase (GGDEF)-like protein
MARITPTLSTIEPDPSLMKKLAVAQRASMAMVVLIAVVILAGWLIPPLAALLPRGWDLMRAETSLAALFIALSLWLTERSQAKWPTRIGFSLAAFILLLTTLILIAYAQPVAVGVHLWLPFESGDGSVPPGRMAPQTAIGFFLLAFVAVAIRTRSNLAVRLADLLIAGLCLLDLILLSGYIFNALRIFGLSTAILTSPQTLVCFLLLTFIVVMRRADKSIFSIFFGRGIGGKTARALAPILLLLPFLREIGRAHLIQSHRIPEHYANAILVSVAVLLSFALLILLAWRIDAMETEIHNLSLRDELTGLYNLRGFHLLAEQALHMAQRSHIPFSVVFIDLDNLKQINDLHGHSVGSASLTETGEMLRATFRATDVLARIGGDEFAVAGQFSHAAVAVATERLRHASVLRNSSPGHHATLSFSIGHVTAESTSHESVRSMLSKADEAMYEEKRRKKALHA